MWLKTCIAVMVLLLLNTWGAKADRFYQMVSYTCDRKGDQIVIQLRGAYNDEGSGMLANKGPDAWDPTTLVSMRDENTIGNLTWVRRRCQLSDGLYDVAISAAPENFNIQGHCGASISAQAKVEFKHSDLLTQAFDRSCSAPNDPVYSRFIVHAKTHEVTLAP